jgi:hypothetical protein
MSYIIEFKTGEKVMHNGADICFLMRQDFIDMFGGSLINTPNDEKAIHWCEIICGYYSLLTGHKVNIDYEFIPFEITE